MASPQVERRHNQQTTKGHIEDHEPQGTHTDQIEPDKNHQGMAQISKTNKKGLYGGLADILLFPGQGQVQGMAGRRNGIPFACGSLGF